MFPQRTPRFEAYIAPAKPYCEIWRLQAGIVVLAVTYFTGIAVVFALSGALLALASGDIQRASQILWDFSKPTGMVILFLTFGGATIGTGLAAKWFHKRSFRTLIAPDFSVLGIHAFKAVHIIFPVFTVFFLIGLWASPPSQNMDFFTWIAWMPMALPLLLLQTSTEEIVFRGYLQQQLAARFKSRWMWMVLPSALFGLLHYEPSELGPNAWLAVVDAGFIGFVAADMTARTGNLGAAIVFHFVNNFFALFLVSINGPMTGFALYVSTFSMSDTAEVANLLVLDIATNAILYFVYARIMTRRGL